jgi:glutathione synthase/RimK-type ligase-like ATP-grasp enzyme
MSSPQLHVINRFTPDRTYLLGVALQRRGVDVVLADLRDLSMNRDAVVHQGAAVTGTFLWRLSENMWPSTRHLAESLGAHGQQVVNSVHALNMCADKLLTATVLGAAGVPCTQSTAVLPGSIVAKGTVAKPVFGAGGRDILFGPCTVALDSREPWLTQPHVGDGADFLRVLVVGGAVIGAYRRIPAHDARTNNVETGGTREYVDVTDIERDLAVAAAAACGALIAGVDLTPEPRQVLEVNGSPGIPASLIDAVADALAQELFRRS